MGAYQCWCGQREKLRESLRDCAETSGAAYLVRHAIAQTEQNTMAEQPDDLLRQQTGILFSCFKTSIGLLDVTVATKVWVAQSQKTAPKRAGSASLLAIAALLLVAAGLLAYTKGLWLVWLPIAAALALGVVGLIVSRRGQRKEAPAEDTVRVTARPDAKKLFAAVDAQMEAIDRCINDFAYLNEQLLLKKGTPDAQNLTLISDMLEALYEADDETREAATLAADRVLEGMGMRAVGYAPENDAMFTVLPSKTETRTIVPAIVALDDNRLLRRGTAAVCAAAIAR